jgi:hypothetical protein
MDHREVEEGNIIDLYLRLELPADKEIAFEEHMLGCTICRENLKAAETALETVEAGKTEEFRNSAGSGVVVKRISGVNINAFMKIAAGILILAGIAGALTLILKNSGNRPAGNVIVQEVGDTLKIKPDKGLSTKKDQVIPDGKAAVIKENNLIAENFTASKFYDNIIENRFRHQGIEIVSPLKDTLTSLPAFRWKGDDSKQLVIIVISNREKEIFRKSIDNGAKLQIRLDPGLYYWQLQNETETLFSGKFIYLPLDGR